MIDIIVAFSAGNYLFIVKQNQNVELNNNRIV